MKKRFLTSLTVILCSLTFSLTNGSAIILGTEDKGDRICRLTSIQGSFDVCLNFTGKLLSSTQEDCDYIKNIVEALIKRREPVHKINMQNVDMSDTSFNLFVNTLSSEKINDLEIIISPQIRLSPVVINALKDKRITITCTVE